MLYRRYGHKWSHLLLLLAVLAPIASIAVYALTNSIGGALLVCAAVVLGVTLVLLLVFVLIAIHEAGHLIGALATGMNVTGFCVGPFRWLKEKETWQFSFYDDTRISGFIIATPKAGKFDRIHYLTMIAGGPVASLIAAVSLFIPFKAFDGAKPILLLPLVLAVFFLLTLIPARIGGVASDGHWLFFLLFRPDDAMRRLVSTRLSALTQLDVPTREWPRELVGMLKGQKTDTVEGLIARVYEMNFALAIEDVAFASASADEAEQALESQDFVDVSGMLKPTVLLQVAAVRAIGEENPAAARAVLQKVETVPDRLQFVRHIVLCYILHMEGDTDGSIKEIQEATPQIAELLHARPRILHEMIDSLGELSDQTRQAAIDALNVSAPGLWQSIPQPSHLSRPPSC